MFRKYLLPALAVAMLGFAVLQVVRAGQQPPKAVPPVDPARTPFGQSVAGAGLVEPQTENIAVGAHVPGVVVEVFVTVGQKVKAGDRLFRLDDRHLKAEERVRRANLADAAARLARLNDMPRPEELPPSEAKVREAEANLADMDDQFKRSQSLLTSRAAGEEEVHRRRQALESARAQLAKAKADLALLKAGAWSADKEVAKAAVDQAKAQLDATKTDLDRLEVRAPQQPGDLDSFEILQVNVRPGEFVGTPPGQALVVIGNVRKLHVRVDIDENDISRFRPGLPGVAKLRGDPRREFPLKFVRVEPYVIPKKSLTGANTERVDTRVLQVIYAIDQGDTPLYVGQQMDVFLDIEAKGFSSD